MVRSHDDANSSTVVPCEFFFFFFFKKSACISITIDNPGAITVEVIHKDHHHLNSSHGLSTLKFNVASRKSITAVLCEEENCEEHPFQEGPASELEAILGKEFKGGNIIELDIQESSSSSMDRAGDGINPEFDDDDDDENEGGKSTGQPKFQKGTVKQHKGPRSDTVRGPSQVLPENGESPHHTDRPHGSTGTHISGRIEQISVEEEDIDISDPTRKHFPGPLAISTEDDVEGEEGGYRRVHVRERIEKITVTEEEEYDDIHRRGGGHQHGGVGIGVGVVVGGTVGGPSMVVPGQWVDTNESERGVVTWGIVDDIPEGFIDTTLIATGRGPEPVLIIPPQRTEIVVPPRATTPVVVYRPQPRHVLVEPPPPPPEPEPVIILPPPRPQPQYQLQPRVLVRPPAQPVYVQPPPPPPMVIQQQPPPPPVQVYRPPPPVPVYRPPPPVPVYRPPPRIIPPPPPPVFVPEPQVVVAPEPRVVVPGPAPIVAPVAVVPEYGTYETIVPGVAPGIGAYGGGVSAYQGGPYDQGGPYGGAYGGAYGGGVFPGGVGGVSALNRGDVASIYENEQGYDVASIYDDRSVASIHELENGPGIVGAGAVVDPYGYDGYGGYGGYGQYGGIPGRRGPVIAGGLGYSQHLVSAAHVERSDSDLRVHRDHSADDDMALASAAFINDRRLGREEPLEQYEEQTWQKRNPQQYQELERGEEVSNENLHRGITPSRDDVLEDMEVAHYGRDDRDVDMDGDEVMEIADNRHAAFPSDSANTEVSYHEVQLEEGPAVMQELAIETYFDTTKSQLKVRQQQGQLLSEMASQLKKRQQQQEEEQFLQQQQQSMQSPAPPEYMNVQAHRISASSQPVLRSPGPGGSSLSQQLQLQQQSPPTLNIPKPPSNPPPVRLLANRGVPTPLVNAARGIPITLGARKTPTALNRGEFEISNRNIISENNIEEGVPGEEENGSEPILSTSASASENIMMQLRNRNSPNLSGGSAKLTTQPIILPSDAVGSAVSRARALISGSILMGASTLSTGKGIGTGTAFTGLTESRSNQSLKHAFKDHSARATAAALASKRRRKGERVAAMSRSHLHPIMLTEGIMACWNNEFAYALDVFKENSATFPRWSLATAEVPISSIN